MDGSHKISTNLIFGILLDYCNDNKLKVGKSRLTQTRLAEALSVHKSNLSKWKAGTHPLHMEMMKVILHFFDQRVTIDASEFFSYMVRRLVSEGFDRHKCSSILENSVNLTTGIEKLLNNYDTHIQHLQNELSRTNIISNLRSLFFQYNDMVNISENKIHPDPQYNNWILGVPADNDKELLVKQNYLILRFLSYRVIIVLSNKAAEMETDEFIESALRLEHFNGINMVIVFTDHQVKVNKQRRCMNQCNLFFETVTRYDLSKTHISGLTMQDLDLPRNYLNARLYAKVIFERFSSYLNVIRNELVFLNRDKSRDYVATSAEEADNLPEFVNRRILKEIFGYPYTTLQAIYFERNRLLGAVEEIKQRTGKTRLGKIVEICYPNCFLSCLIQQKCEDLYLFTSSHAAYRFVEDENEKRGHSLMPKNIHHELMHPSPQYINAARPDLLGQVDLVILGLGSASSISNLTEYMRYVNSWLSPNGAVLISFTNADSAIVQRRYGINEYWRQEPMDFGLYWHTQSSEKVSFLKYEKKYSIEEAKRAVDPYVSSSSFYTYPFLSELMDPRRFSDALMQEVKRIDDEVARNEKQKSRFGHYITIIGHRDTVMSDKRKRKEIHNNIIEYLEAESISYTPIVHEANIDENGWRQILIDKGHDYNQFDIVKTIILQEKAGTDPHVHYCIMKGSTRIKFNSDYTLLPEKRVIENYGKGCISPLVVLPQNTELTQYQGPVYLIEPDELKKAYVIISAGISTESLMIRTDDFKKIMQEMHAVHAISRDLTDVIRKY